MQKHAAYMLTARDWVAREEYGVVFCSAPPKDHFGAALYAPLTIEDYRDPPPKAMLENHWSEYVALYKLMLVGADGERIQGWGGTRRFCTDLGSPTFSALSAAEVIVGAIPEWASGLYLDDLYVKPGISQKQKAAVARAGHLPLWRNNNLTLLYYLARMISEKTLGIQGGKRAFFEDVYTRKADMIKLEGFRWGEGAYQSTGWGGQPGRWHKFADWVVGADWTPGLRGLQDLIPDGQVVLEAWVPVHAGDDVRNVYAGLGLACVMMFDNAMLMIHEEKVNDPEWWKHPLWFPIFDELALLGEPVAPMQMTVRSDKAPIVSRQFERGRLSIDLEVERAWVEGGLAIG
jgi:hypothetical protein